jgi:hypothetical protein
MEFSASRTMPSHKDVAHSSFEELTGDFLGTLKTLYIEIIGASVPKKNLKNMVLQRKSKRALASVSLY